MSSHELALSGLKILAEGALPYADVTRNQAKPTRVGPGGNIDIRNGEAVLIDTEMSPLRYIYERRVPVNVLAYEGTTLARELVLDQMLEAIGEAVAANRRLNINGEDRCEWLDLEAPDLDDLDATGAETIGGATFYFVVTYGTANPLT